MKSASHQTLSKRPVNLLLSEGNIREAELSGQQLGDAVADAWNRFHAVHGAFADDHSTL